MAVVATYIIVINMFGLKDRVLCMYILRGANRQYDNYNRIGWCEGEQITGKEKGRRISPPALRLT